MRFKTPIVKTSTVKILQFKFQKAILADVVGCHNFETDVKNTKANHLQMYTNKLHFVKKPNNRLFIKNILINKHVQR